MADCNYCNLRRYKADARRAHMKITVLADATWGMGGVNVYEHPKDVSIHKLSGGEDGDRAQYRISWMMELPDHCAC